MSFITRVTIIFSIILSGQLLPSKLVAQTVDTCTQIPSDIRLQKAITLISSIKKGVLLVELDDQKKSIEALTKLANNPKVSSAKKAQLLKRRGIREENIRTWTQTLVPVFREHYAFSKVLFYYRSDRSQIHDMNAPIWLNDSGEKGAASFGIGQDYAVISRRATKKQSLEAFYLFDKNFGTLCPPAPQYYRVNTISSLFKWGKKEDIQKAKKLAENVTLSFERILERK